MFLNSDCNKMHGVFKKNVFVQQETESVASVLCNGIG
jgi:hypothetical protein